MQLKQEFKVYADLGFFLAGFPYFEKNGTMRMRSPCSVYIIPHHHLNA
jgi:hypothetical protein